MSAFELKESVETASPTGAGGLSRRGGASRASRRREPSSDPCYARAHLLPQVGEGGAD